MEELLRSLEGWGLRYLELSRAFEELELGRADVSTGWGMVVFCEEILEILEGIEGIEELAGLVEDLEEIETEVQEIDEWEWPGIDLEPIDTESMIAALDQVETAELLEAVDEIELDPDTMQSLETRIGDIDDDLVGIEETVSGWEIPTIDIDELIASIEGSVETIGGHADSIMLELAVIEEDLEECLALIDEIVE